MSGIGIGEGKRGVSENGEQRRACPSASSTSGGGRGNLAQRKIAIFVLMYLLLEGSIFLGLWMLQSVRGIVYDPVITELSDNQKGNLDRFLRGDSGSNFRQDPVLGWVPLAETNAAGMRDDSEYELLLLVALSKLQTLLPTITNTYQNK